ncbi:colicin Z C-terminal domain-related protein [Xenorhabdus thuongxuanensis]|uniref:Uncharacterized protein n=2 Tax=Xenorhabdus thuongxuanensis TaxID=1873484 RepID=A0A1Q5U2I7_9GAMM|nr:colicin Z C-terminal domain-related protein [Xenorhabdus thuongxuanensis]OKP06651.1 hypothetical protein Xentx_01990 [Xenorhabdus thuongxuanensis]
MTIYSALLYIIKQVLLFYHVLEMKLEVIMRTTAWAPPLTWGPWIGLENHVGSYAYTVSFDTISQAPSSFDVEIQYATNGGYRTVTTMGPGSYQIRGNDGAGQDRIRFKSHSIGQSIELTY